jgi:UDP-N-acetylmuramoylalanine--D-glutamate ligase
MKKQDKRIVILGAGESGVGAALLARAKGYVPFVSDSGSIKAEYKSVLLNNGISVEEGKHTEQLILSADEIIKSPGIPALAPVMTRIKEKGIPVISEIEFASRYTKAKIIAVTGTNGKSTTTYLTWHLMKEAGLRVCMAGNVGNSFAREVIENKYDYYVLEISSFQLDDMYDFKADIAVLLNITPDHLDRYDHDMNRYIESKFRIMQNQGKGDYLIYYLGDKIIADTLGKIDDGPVRLPVSLAGSVRNGAWLEKDRLCFNFNSTSLAPFSLPVTDLPLRGPHNMINLMSAVLAVTYAGLGESQVKNGLKNFVNFPHRMEKVMTRNGVTWVNDSKATNIDSARYAIDSYDSPIVWIVGGIDKGNDYGLIRELVKRSVKAIVCLGRDNSKIIESFKNDIERIIDTDNLKTAVTKADQLAEAGDVVLLSPACASFDLFRNYVDRGDQFREAVKELYNKKEI